MSHTVRRLRYVLKRLLQSLPIILAIVVVNFFLLQLAEGDAVDVLAGESGSATPEYMAELRAKFGLDQPLPVQLVRYLGNVLCLISATPFVTTCRFRNWCCKGSCRRCF